MGELLTVLERENKDFPGGLAAKTLSFQCRMPGFNLLSGNYVPHAETKEFNAATRI